MYNGDTKEFSLAETNDESVNEIIEIRNGEEIETLEEEILDNMSYEEPKVEEKPKKKKKNIFKLIKDKWNDLTKKQKIITIVIISVIFIALIVTLVLVLKNNKDEVIEEPVVLEADNYRYENGKLFFLDAEGNDIGSYDCVNKDETLCYVAYSSNEDNFDIEQNIHEDETIVNKRMSIINDNYVFIYDNKTEDEENIILHSITENADHESFKLVKEYDLEDNYVVAKDDSDNYGVLLFNEEGYEEVIEFKYEYLGIITENKEENKYLVGVKNSKWYLIDYKEKEISKGMDYEIKNYSDYLISVVNENDEYYLYDFKNNLATEEGYDYINFANDFVFLVKDKELFIADKELNKLYEEGIKLKEEDYNKVNIFNKETGKLVESKYAYDISINNNTINLSIKNGEEDEVKLINTLESVVSSHYDNVNYFGGKLYFYSDAEKTNLLGSYECTNANDIASENSNLDNCYIATNSEFSDNDMSYAKKAIGTLPIFNNRFVFIKDTPELTSESTMNITLYDLKSDKKLGSYRAIDAGSYNGKNGINFVETTGALLIAKNTKDYYGILKINLSEVVSLENVKFNDKYKRIEEINGNYIIQKSTDTYYMINNKGESLTSEFSGKIMGYKNNHVKVKSGNNYSVFTFDGTEVNKTKFNYVELYDNFFAGVDSSNKLNLYTYTSETPIFSESIALSITSNYREGKSFTATQAGTSYKVTIYNVNGSTTTYDSATIVNNIE